MVWPILISVAVTPGMAESPPPLSATPGADFDPPSPSAFFFSQPAARMRQTPVNAASRGAVVTMNQFRFDMYPPLGDTGESPVRTWMAWVDGCDAARA